MLNSKLCFDSTNDIIKTTTKLGKQYSAKRCAKGKGGMDVSPILPKQAGISSSSLTKLGKGENVTTGVLLRICAALNCVLDDIAVIIRDNGNRDCQ